ncbi:hypothetical protein ASF92_18820 [Pedobacter sp. Leaf176]|nr:hypothetical protein ASF92_18820 [Pedobacter sp. Leaf176]
MQENKEKKPCWIVVRTSHNQKAASAIDFFHIEVSQISRHILVKYENEDQVSAICRLLVDLNIDVMEIYLSIASNCSIDPAI